MQSPINSRDTYLQTYANRSVDTSISISEKSTLKLSYDKLLNTQVVLASLCSKYSLNTSTEKTVYDNSITALSSYLATLLLPVLWSDTSSYTYISNRATLDSYILAVSTAENNLSILIDSQDALADTSTPPVPTGLYTTSKFANIVVTWVLPDTYKYIGHIEVWRSTSNNRASASLVGISVGTNFSDYIDSFSTVYYWIRFVSKSNIYGPYNSTTGTAGNTGSDPSYLLNVLEAQVNASTLSTDISTDINRVPVDAEHLEYILAAKGTSLAAYDHATSSYTTADKAMSTLVDTYTSTANSNKIRLISYTNTVAGLSAEKFVKIDSNGLISGYGIHSSATISEFIVTATNFAFGMPGNTSTYPFIVGNVNSIWTTGINGAVVVDGTITAKSIITDKLSAITAILGNIVAGDLYSTVIHTGGGFPHSTYTWPTNSGIGFHLSSSGLLIGNPSLGSYLEIKANGDFHTATMNITSGSAILSGIIGYGTGNYMGKCHGGSFTSYAWPSSGGTGFYLGPEGLLLGNPSTGKYFQIASNGDVNTSAYHVTDGTMYIDQANVINTVHIRDNAVTNAMSVGNTSGAQNLGPYDVVNTGALGIMCYEPIDIIYIITWQVSSTAWPGYPTSSSPDIYLDNVLVQVEALTSEFNTTISHTVVKKISLNTGYHYFWLAIRNRLTNYADSRINIGQWSFTILGVTK